MAIRCAAAVAAVGGVLAVVALRVPLLTPATVLWTMSGSLITLGLYQNRRPAARMDARIGARIGTFVGICLAVGLALPVALAGVVARFWPARDGQLRRPDGRPSYGPADHAAIRAALRHALPPDIIAR